MYCSSYGRTVTCTSAGSTGTLPLITTSTVRTPSSLTPRATCVIWSISPMQLNDTVPAIQSKNSRRQNMGKSLVDVLSAAQLALPSTLFKPYSWLRFSQIFTLSWFYSFAAATVYRSVYRHHSSGLVTKTTQCLSSIWFGVSLSAGR